MPYVPAYADELVAKETAIIIRNIFSEELLKPGSVYKIEHPNVIAMTNKIKYLIITYITSKLNYR